MSYRATGVMYGKKERSRRHKFKTIDFHLKNSCINPFIYDVYFNKFLGVFFNWLEYFCILLHDYFINTHAFIKTFKQLIFSNWIHLTREIVNGHLLSILTKQNQFVKPNLEKISFFVAFKPCFLFPFFFKLRTYMFLSKNIFITLMKIWMQLVIGNFTTPRFRGKR